MPKSLRVESQEILTIAVEIDGKTMSEQATVKQITVDHALNRVPRATVSFADGSPSEEDFALSRSADVLPGAKVKIRAGYHASNEVLFFGIVLKHAIQLRENGETQLVLSCADPAIALTCVRRTRHFANQKDSDALSQIIRDAGLKADISATSETVEQIVQHNATDWDFLLMRAAANGHVVSVYDGRVTVAPPQLDTPEYEARFGESLLSFDATLDAGSQIAGAEAKAWDFARQEAVSASAPEPGVNRQGDVTGKSLARSVNGGEADFRSFGALSAKGLQTWSVAQLLNSRLARLYGRAKLAGSAKLRPGQTLELGGMSPRFNGAAYMSAVHHHLMAGEWDTEVQFGLDPHLHQRHDVANADSPAAAGLRPGVFGPQYAKVRQTHDDPLGQGRIEVTLPLSGNAALWVRVVTPYAGNETGIDFLPEVGDEVVIDFLDGDPQNAVCLGGLHSSKRPAPQVPDKTNTFKTIRTRSGITLQFDDEKVVADLSTPAGHKVTLDDDAKTLVVQDSHGNAVKLSKDGISLKSIAAVQIEAATDIDFTAGGTLNGEAKTDISLRALNISQDASAAFSAKGATSKLDASGPMTISGLPVKIN